MDLMISAATQSTRGSAQLEKIGRWDPGIGFEGDQEEGEKTNSDSLSCLFFFVFS